MITSIIIVPLLTSMIDNIATNYILHVRRSSVSIADGTLYGFDKLSFTEAISRNLKVMDMTAFTLCQENNLPIIVFDMNKTGNLVDLVKGIEVGTLVS